MTDYDLFLDLKLIMISYNVINIVYVLYIIFALVQDVEKQIHVFRNGRVLNVDTISDNFADIILRNFCHAEFVFQTRLS